MFALIMAGGSGTRFWPKSREKHPKQLLNIYGEKSLIQNTVDRLNSITDAKNIFIVSTADQQAALKKQLPQLPESNYIVEPKGKNTAPCIGLSALFIERIDPDAVMVVLPADHLITQNKRFHKTIMAGVKVAAERDCLVTIGIQPTYPSTGYGYIQFNEQLESSGGVDLYQVKTFAEKPNLSTAKRFLKSGDFLWNSGMFIWGVRAIMKEIEEHLPHLYQGLTEIRAAMGTAEESEVISRVYCQIKNISIDYGVMEQAKDVAVLRGEFGWNDLGSWDEVYNLHKKDKDDNVLLGRHIVKDARGCYIDSENKSVALIGVEDLVVVDTEDALLICPRDKAQDVKEVVELAKRKKMNHIL